MDRASGYDHTVPASKWWQAALHKDNDGPLRVGDTFKFVDGTQHNLGVGLVTGNFDEKGHPRSGFVMPGQVGNVTIVTLVNGVVTPEMSVHPVPDEWFKPIGAAAERHAEWMQAQPALTSG